MKLRSGSVHLELAVEVRQCPLRSGTRSWGRSPRLPDEKEKEKEEAEATLIKSRDPHLAWRKHRVFSWIYHSHKLWERRRSWTLRNHPGFPGKVKIIDSTNPGTGDFPADHVWWHRLVTVTGNWSPFRERNVTPTIPSCQSFGQNPLGLMWFYNILDIFCSKGWFTVGFATLPQWSKQSKQAYSGFWYIFGGPMSNLAQNRRDAPLNYLHDTSLWIEHSTRHHNWENHSSMDGFRGNVEKTMVFAPKYKVFLHIFLLTNSEMRSRYVYIYTYNPRRYVTR